MTYIFRTAPPGRRSVFIADVERERRESTLSRFRAEESKKRFNTAPLGAPDERAERVQYGSTVLPWGLIPFISEHGTVFL